MSAAGPPGSAFDVPATVGAQLSATAGRYLVSARDQHFVTDSLRGPAEAVSAIELLLASLASCAIANVDRHGRDLGLDLTDAHVTVRAERDPDDGTRFSDIVITVSLPRAASAGTREVVARFTGTCPIYNSLRRAAPVRVVLGTTPAVPS